MLRIKKLIVRSSKVFFVKTGSVDGAGGYNQYVDGFHVVAGDAEQAIEKVNGLKNTKELIESVEFICQLDG